MQWVPCSATRRSEALTIARFGHSTVFIPGTSSVWGTDLVVVFGGVSYTDGDAAVDHHAALSDVVVLQADADKWFSPQVTPASASAGLPEARAYHCAAAVDRRVYVFGGHVLSYDTEQNKKRRRFFNDLWCLDTDTWTWERLDAGSGPGAFPGAAPEQPLRRDMATLTRAGPSCLLLFGGRLETGRASGDAWVLDLTTHTWSQLKVPGPAPPARKMHSAVYATNRVVVFGGERDPSGVLDDLWTIKGADGSEPAKWTQIKLRPAPSGRFGHAMAASGSRLAVFGGCLDQSSLIGSFIGGRTFVQCNELWVLDMATFSWHRVEPPEGTTPVSGIPLNDPNLLNHLQHQAALQASAASFPGGPAPPQQQVLLLPAERMCHSLVAVGAGRLLLVGGRKRDGICDEAWWLSMGPDNLTPVLTVPPPEIVAAAALSAAQITRRPSSALDVPSPGPSPTPVPGLNRRSSGHPMGPSEPTPPTPHGVPPPPHPQPSPSTASSSLLTTFMRKGLAPGKDAGTGGAAAASSSSLPDRLGPPPSGLAPSPPSDGRSTRNSASGMDTGASGTDPAGGGMSTSRSAGILRDPAGGQQGPPVLGGALPSGAGVNAVPPSGVGGGAGAGGASTAASSAFRNIANKIQTLIQPGLPGRTPSVGSLAGPQVAPGAAAGLARATSGSVGGDKTAAGPSPPSASSLPPDVAASWTSLRTRLGLPLAPRSGSDPSVIGSQSSVSRPLPAADPIDPLPALATLGQQLAGATRAASGGGVPSGAAAPPLPRPGSPEAEVAVARARRHLACCAAEQLAVGQLPVLLADCQALLKARAGDIWAALEVESWRRASSADASSHPPPPPPPDLAVLATYVSSLSHPVAGLRMEGLRLGDVADLLTSYRTLVLSGEEAVAVGAVAVV